MTREVASGVVQKFTTSVIPAGNAGTQTPGMADQGWQKPPVNSREITIGKTLRPTTNIRAVMSIVEEESHISASRQG
uniref:Uncharacterized protein n=1 Tax=Candidatus Kentrum sp. LFY TaxID=2126342 RepID=A0A450V018_9GAMM|nr:MAG: hypothetical protein BECKLFY1418A_GA0070994_107914 [Candidatus Kentron sp. LFY]